jgi:hypothetical protein
MSKSRRFRNNLRGFDCLEARLAPASTVVFTDPNGDRVKFSSSLGNLAGDISSTPAPDGMHNDYSVNLTDPSFNGTNFSVAVTKSKTGDGLAIIGLVNAATNNLGTVSIAADLGDIDAGNLSATVPAIKSLTVDSFGRFGQRGTGNYESDVFGNVPSLVVKHDVNDSYFGVDGDLASVKIGGSLIGGADAGGGEIYCTGNLGDVSIKHDIRGADGTYSGSVGAGHNVRSVTVGGSVYGGNGNYSGDIFAALTMSGKISKVSVGGSVVGGAGYDSAMIGGGLISSGPTLACSLGIVTIGNDVVGGSGIQSGDVWALAGTLDQLRVKGSLIGGLGTSSGSIQADGHVGSIHISGSVCGGPGDLSAWISLFSSIGSLEIDGSLIGGSGGSSGAVWAKGGIKMLTIHGDVRGGSGGSSGDVNSNGVGIATTKIGGAIVPGTGASSGIVQ